MSMNCHIGTSGWNYAAWKDDFYAGIPRRAWLAHAASCFTGLEINATFYGAQKPATLQRWCDETPGEFRFAVKGSRFITHRKRLLDPRDALAREREQLELLGGKLAVVLWQLPANFRSDPARLEHFAAALGQWPKPRHAIEFRHRSWFNGNTLECLQRHRIAVCQSDAADWPLWDALSTDLVYLRLHGHTRTYRSAYRRDHLQRWAGRIRGWLRQGFAVHLYFDNTDRGAAPRNALQLLRMPGMR